MLSGAVSQQIACRMCQSHCCCCVGSLTVVVVCQSHGSDTMSQVSRGRSDSSAKRNRDFTDENITRESQENIREIEPLVVVITLTQPPNNSLSHALSHSLTLRMAQRPCTPGDSIRLRVCSAESVFEIYLRFSLTLTKGGINPLPKGGSDDSS